MESGNKTGIEPRIEFGSATHVVTKTMPKNAGKWMGGSYRLRVALDGGKEQLFAVHEQPLLECAPGSHEVTLALAISSIVSASSVGSRVAP